MRVAWYLKPKGNARNMTCMWALRTGVEDHSFRTLSGAWFLIAKENSNNLTYWRLLRNLLLNYSIVAANIAGDLVEPAWS